MNDRDKKLTLEMYTTMSTELVGKTLAKVEVIYLDYGVKPCLIRFIFTDSTKYVMCGDDCGGGNHVEVLVEDIDGDIQSLVGEKIELFECVSNAADVNNELTWTFVKIRTNKDSITIRWYGDSNGYYSDMPVIYNEDS